MQDAGSSLDASGQKGKDILDSFGDALMSNFSTAAVGKVVAELDKGASTLLKQFGVGQEMAQTLRATMADAVTNVRTLGGDIADVIKTQQDASKALQRNVILSAEVNKDLYATMKVTGQEVGALVSGFKDVGIGAGRVAGEMKKVVDIAAQSGVNAADVSAKVLQNMDALNKYNFEGGVSGLAKMAAQASLLRIDMSQTLAFAEKVFDPEGAIEMAAAMQRLGVSQSSLLDPLKMMDLAQNDPAELQNQIAQMSKQFVQLGKDGNFEIMPGAKRQMREISKAMGIPYEQLTKMALGSAELEDKMSKIRFPDLPGLDEDKQKMIANMAEMGAGGKYEVQVKDEETGQTITKAIDQLNEKDVANLEKMANTAPKTMEELAVEQLSVTEKMAADIKSLADKTGLGIARTKTMGSGLNFIRDTSTAVRKTLSPKQLDTKNLASSIDNSIDKNLNVLKRLTDGEISAGEARQEVAKNLSEFSKFFSSIIETSFKQAKNESNNIEEKYPDIKLLKQAVTGDFRGVAGTEKPDNNVIEREIGNVSNPSTIQDNTITTNNNTSTNIIEREISNVRNTSTIPTNTSATNNGSSTDKPIEITLNHKIDINASSNIDTNQILMAFKNTDVQQGMVGALKDAMYSNGLMAPTSNKTQLMNSNISANSLV